MGRDGAGGGTITSAKMEMGHPQQQGGDPEGAGETPASWITLACWMGCWAQWGREGGGIAGEQLSREWGAQRGPAEAHCTQGDASKGGRDKRVCAEGVREWGIGNEGPGPTRGESRGPGEAGAARGGAGCWGEATQLRAGTSGTQGRRANTVGYRGHVCTPEGREAVGRDVGAGRAPRESSGGSEGSSRRPGGSGEGAASGPGGRQHGRLPPSATGPRGSSPVPVGPPPLPPLRLAKAGGRGARPSSPGRGPTGPGGEGPGGQRYLTAPGAIPPAPPAPPPLAPSPGRGRDLPLALAPGAGGEGGGGCPVPLPLPLCLAAPPRCGWAWPLVSLSLGEKRKCCNSNY